MALHWKIALACCLFVQRTPKHALTFDDRIPAHDLELPTSVLYLLDEAPIGLRVAKQSKGCQNRELATQKTTMPPQCVETSSGRSSGLRGLRFYWTGKHCRVRLVDLKLVKEVR